MADNSDRECVVCYNRAIKIYSIGFCNHPVCFECSSRMRVLCSQNECPICRSDMPLVIFSATICKFSDMNPKCLKLDNSYKIAFESPNIEAEYKKLFSNNCKECGYSSIFADEFSAHMRKSHQLYFCEICDRHLKLFPREKRWYNLNDLARHKRVGDADDSSRRGHPLCQFCFENFLDKDELYRHLRMMHYFCHICDNQGFDNFYKSYDTLRIHYKKEHFLCEEGLCSKEQFTCVFASEFELKTHKALKHGNKQGAGKFNRLDVNFFMPSRQSSDRDNGRSNDQPNGNDEGQSSSALSNFPVATPSWANSLPHLEAEFPALGNTSSGTIPIQRPMTVIKRGSSNRLAKTNENFPALGMESAPTNYSNNSVPYVQSILSVPINRDSVPVNRNLANNKRVTSFIQLDPASSNSSSPPSTSWSAKSKSSVNGKSAVPPAKSIAQNQKSVPVKEDFPSLDGGGGSNLRNSNLAESRAGQAPPSSNKLSLNSLKKSTMTIQLDHIIGNGKKNNKHNKNNSDEKGENDKNKNKNDSSKNTNNCNKNKNLNQINSGGKNSNLIKSENHKKVKMKINQNNVLSTKKSTVTAFINDYTDKKNLVGIAISDESCKKQNKQQKDNDRGNNSKKGNKNKNISSSARELTEIAKNLKIGGESSSDKANVKNHKKASEQNHSVSKIGNIWHGGGISPSNKENKRNELSLTGRTLVQPPPGFSGGSSAIQIGLSFTNSQGQSYNMNNHNDDETTDHFVYKYICPPDFVNRNRQLITKISNALCNQEQENVDGFRNASLLYRDNYITGIAYYTYCKDHILPEYFDGVFLELLILLPDVYKQQELWSIHHLDRTDKDEPLRATVCSKCYQILAMEDVSAHIFNH